ncbi:MAG: lysophospholipid acyltransferase family protein [Actinomycetota bacterium]|nr:lysophospholipid acyltransferase family protein [Actinomycetota bacterium]
MWWRYIILRPPFALVGKRKKYNLKVSGEEYVPRYGPYIVISNHQSSVDIIAIALALRRGLVRNHMWPWAKTEIEGGAEGFLGKMLWKVFGVIPIDREHGDAREPIDLSLKYLRRGELICIFPEGTRSKNKQLGWFEYGVANLAKAAPAPILPVAVYRRDSDRGVQVNIGKPFFLPPKRRRYEMLEALEERVEDKFIHQVETLRQWADALPKDKKGMKIIANMIKIIADFVSRQDIVVDRFYRMAESDDSEFIRERVFELLPADWIKAEHVGKGPLSLINKE